MSHENFHGLTLEEVQKQRQKYGLNVLTPQKKNTVFKKILKTLCEPAFLLLLAAALIYFLLGELKDAVLMSVFVVVMIALELFQELKTDRTLDALKTLTAPQITVIREGEEITIPSTELVPKDIMIVQEGVKIPADGKIIFCHDFCVDESSMTGEAEGVWKSSFNENTDERLTACYAGTLCIQGTAYIEVEQIGLETKYGKISQTLNTAPPIKTPLQKQTASLVKVCSLIAVALMLLVCAATWLTLGSLSLGERFVQSILSGITLAMAMIPEEFPVVLTVFLSMGAARLAKKKALIRRLNSVETLGAVSVLCVDKTGTVTMNQMTVQSVYTSQTEPQHFDEIMGMACEIDAYDPMEQAILNYCEMQGINRQQLFNGKLLKEYAFTNQTKMMGHLWLKDDKICLAVKGSPENVIRLCELNDKQIQSLTEQMEIMAKQGMRVLAVAEQTFENTDDAPQDMTDCQLKFLGLVGLIDPPRSNIDKQIAQCTKAGIRVVMITGDNGVTAANIAQKIGIPNAQNVLCGHDIDSMTDDELQTAVKTINIFSRVVPEHKMRIVKAFRNNGEITAMTGDGVNDAPALKYADIGIAMGKRGSEVSKEAADLILMDDNFSTIVDTIRDGRRIYDNIRKAVSYIFAIHIPIACAALLVPLLGISPDNALFLPAHIVLLELLIDPTCSVVLERQPCEKNILSRPPRNPKEKLLNFSVLGKGVIQGLVVAAATFGVYAFTLSQTGNAPIARAMGLSLLVLSNLFLVFVNSSEYDSVFYSIYCLRHEKIMWAATIITLILVAIIIYTPLSSFFMLSALSFLQMLSVIGLAIVSVGWYEIVKSFKRKSILKNNS